MSTFPLENGDSNTSEYDDVPLSAAAAAPATYQGLVHSAVPPKMPPVPSPMTMMIDGTTGNYHPDFMFCGSCSTCQEDKKEDDHGTRSVVAGTARNSTSNNHDDDLLILNGSTSNKNSHHNSSLRSKFSLLDQTTSSTDDKSNRSNSNSGMTASHQLVIRSMIQPLAGVTDVDIHHHVDASASPTTVDITHDAQTSVERISQILQSIGHNPQYEGTVSIDHDLMLFRNSQDSSNPDNTAANTANNGNNHPTSWVKSTFAVKGICCASEIPAIRTITSRYMSPHVQASQVKINLTTKHVYVQHDSTNMTAQAVASIFTKHGFPATILKDGNQHNKIALPSSLHYSDNKDDMIGRTTLHVQGVLVQQDIGPIQEALRQQQQQQSDVDETIEDPVTRVGVNVAEGVIFVDHNVNHITSSQLVQLLQTNAGYNTKVALAGEDIVHSAEATRTLWTTTGHSKYVESTIVISNNEDDDDGTDNIMGLLQKAISQNYIRAQVRAVHPQSTSVSSTTATSSIIVKVEHNPNLISIPNIVDTLAFSYRMNCSVAVDGAVDGLYLPLQEQVWEDTTSKNQTDILIGGGSDHQQLQLTVLISGVFWVLSIVSYFGDEWGWFKYFGLGAVVFGLPPIAGKAWRTVRRRQFDANVMMCIAAFGAVALGEFDEAASVAFLFSISEWLEASASSKARKALHAILQLRPDHATIIHPITKQLLVVPADKVPLGAILSVKTGDKIAADGIVLEGSSAVNESSLTGEALPAHKQAGDTVRGGTVNIGSSQLVVQTTSTVDDSVVSRLVQLIEEAQSNQSATEKMIDTFARSYTPSVVFLAAIMCTLPWLWGVEVGRYWTLNGLIIIVIACPCALTISTPVTYAAGLAAAAQRGIIVKSGAHLEAMGFVETVVFDKTGTLTQGKFSVLDLQVVGDAYSRKEMLELLTVLQGRSSHPLSATLVEAAQKEGIVPPRDWTISNHSLLKGEGVTAVINDQEVYAGNTRLFERLGMVQNLPDTTQQCVRSWLDAGSTVGFLGTQANGIIGVFSVTDSVRKEAKAIIRGLQDGGIETIICTGDSETAALCVAREVGIAPENVKSQLLPEDKLHIVGRLKRPQPKSFALCRSKQYVAFCGDGVNDGPALAVADVGISMGEGAAVAMEVSDITLMDSNLTKLSYVIHMGRRVVRTIKENICISLFSKLAVVGLTFAGRMTLLTAIAADVGIMLVVTLNGMKLLPSKSETSGIDVIDTVTNLSRPSKSVVPSTAGRMSGDNEAVELTSTLHEGSEMV